MMKRTRVVLADDHADVAAHLVSILEAECDVVAVVGDGSALVAAAEALAPDVIVSDIAMPQMGGLDATAEILRRTPSARIVLVTTYEGASVRHRALSAGALGFVAKITADHDLLPAVRAASRGERFVGSS